MSKFLLADEIYNGRLPIELTWNVRDIATTSSLRPYYGLFSRYSYLSIIANDMIQYLKDHIVSVALTEHEIWYVDDAKQLYLKPTLPIGVLYDLLHNDSCNPRIPWKIQINFQNGKSYMELNCSNIDLTKRYYLHALKQALFLIHGSTNLYSNLSSEHQDVIWNGLFQAQSQELFNEHRLVLDKFSPVDLVMKQLPLRIIFIQNNEFSTIQQSIRMLGIYTLLDVVQKCMNNFELIKTHNAICQGIIIPWEAPILEIWQLFCHSDLFLYLVLHLKE